MCEAYLLRSKIVEDVPPGDRCRGARTGSSMRCRCGVRALGRGRRSWFLEGNAVLTRSGGSLILECGDDGLTYGWLLFLPND